MFWEVSPLFHKYLKPAGAESCTDPDPQNEVGPFAVIIGVAGVVLIVTTVGAEVLLVQVPIIVRTV
jgi:hypothetical protein